jgi:uncharacterized membrane-anchored protein
VLDEVDLDGATAQALVARGVVAVVNAAPSSSGRYPNLGPAVLVDAGVALVDGAGTALFAAARDGVPARLDGGTLWIGEQMVASGRRHDGTTVAQVAAEASSGIGAQLADLSVNASAFAVEQQELLGSGLGLPVLQTPFTGRHVVVVGPGREAAQELRTLRRFVRRNRPLLVGVDGGAAVLFAAGRRPDLVLGDPATMSDEVLRQAREVCLRAAADGLDRVHELAVPAVSYAVRAAAEDVAVLAAHHGGALTVTLAGGAHGLVELLDRGREAAASTPFTRVATGPSLLSARTAAALTPRRSWGPTALIVLLVGALAAVSGVAHEDLLRIWRDLGR